MAGCCWAVAQHQLADASVSASVAQRIGQQGEGRRGLPAARGVEMVARKRRTPVGEHPDEPSTGKVRLHVILEQACHVARQSKLLVQRQSAIHPMVEQRSVGKLVSSPKPPEAGAQRARLYTSLTAGHHNSRMQLTLDDTHSRQ